MVQITDSVLVGLLDAAPDAMVAVDSDGGIVLVNAQAERLFGYARADLLGRSVDALVPGTARGSHPAHRGRYAADPRPRPMGAGMELAGRRADGTEFPAEISLSALETDEGTLVVAAIRDVTDRKRADAKFRGLLEAAPDAIVGVDGRGTITLVNAQTVALFGYARSELLGQPVEMLVPLATRGVHPRHRDAYFADPRTRPMGAGMALAGRRKDGTEFPAEISLSAFEGDDGMIVSAAIRDVTERIEVQRERDRLEAQHAQDRLRAQLNQSQRLESLGQLAGGIAHDLNNLLGVILNYSAFVQETLETIPVADEDRSRFDEARLDLRQIQSAAERATALTRRLLAFGRSETIRPEVLDLNAIVRDVERLLKRTLGEHVRLETGLAADLSAIEADRGQLEQVLVNLAVNARDAMPSGGQLTLDTANFLVDAEYAQRQPGLRPGPHVRLRVSDNGEGMSHDVMERAFEPFFTTKAKGEGTGLGLATVYGIVNQAGGSIRLYSERGLGTTVSILLPAVAATVRDREEPETPPHIPGGETVLLVEDEAALREVARRILVRNGYMVLVAAEGAEAIAIASAHPDRIDLLLTDVVMPQMSGHDVARRVSELRPGLPVLFMSGYAEPVIASQAPLDRPMRIVPKPFTEAVLLEAMRELFALHEGAAGGGDAPNVHAGGQPPA